MIARSISGGARGQTLALLAAVFVAGGLAGAAVERLRVPADVPGDRGRFRTPSGEIPDFYERLDLTSEQRSRIQAILDAGRPETDSLLRVAIPRLRELTESTRTAIRDVLTPEQQSRLDERFRRSREESRRSGERGGDRRRRDGPPR
jgi:Spy/CpxP family protein refolding chaperone